MVDANWPRQGEPDFSGWLDQLDDEEGTFEQRWLRLSEGCLRIFRRAPVGVLPPACGPAGEAATIYEIAALRKGFKYGAGEVATDPELRDSTPDTELQFRWQDRCYRFRASHASLRDKWVAVLAGGLRSLPASALMQQGRVAMVGSDGVSKEVWASLTHTASEKAAVKSSLWCYPTLAAGAEGLSDAEAVPPADDVLWGQPAPLRSRTIALDIPTPEELYKAFDISAPKPDPPAAVHTVESPIEVAMDGIREVQSGYDDAGRAFSLNEEAEFQMSMQVGETRRFRTRTRKEQDEWMAALRGELAAAVENRDDPVYILHTLMTPLMEEAPLVDEDVHFVLFTHDESKLGRQRSDSGGMQRFPSVDAPALPKGMPPVPKPTVPKPSKPKPGQTAEEHEAQRVGIGEQLIEMHRTAEQDDVAVPRSEVELWCKSLGIKRWQHYGRLLTDKQMEMADVPFFTEEVLKDLGVKAMGPRNRMLNSIKFMTKKRGKLKYQVLLPNTNSITTVDCRLQNTVGDLKKRLLFRTQVPERIDMRQKEVRRAEGPLKPQNALVVTTVPPAGSKEDLERTAAAKEHTLKLVSRMEPFHVNTVLEDGQLLREVPFVYFGVQRGITPRLVLQKNDTNSMKHALLLLVCGKLQEASARYPTAVAQFGDSQQLRDFLQIARAIEHMVDTQTIEDGVRGLVHRCQSFAAKSRHDEWRSADLTGDEAAAAQAMREKQRLDAHFVAHVYLSTDSATHAIKGLVLREDWVAKPVVMPCTGETTVEDVLAEFRQKFDRGSWAELLGKHEGKMLLKQHNYADVFEPGERLYSYDVTRAAIDNETPLRVTVILSPLAGAIDEAPTMAKPTPHPSIRLLLKEHAWLQPDSMGDTPVPEPEPEPEPEKHKRVGAEIDRYGKKMQPGSREHAEALERDPLSTLDKGYSDLVWSLREKPEMQRSSRILPKMIRCCPTWDDPVVVKQAYELLGTWAPLGPAEAMQLLDPSFWALCTTEDKGFGGGKLDEKRIFRRFRDHAVECLAKMGDGEFETYLLELCQLMKHEKLHNSALVRLLLYRGLKSPFTVGQSLFWHLRSEMHEGGGPTIFSLYGMFLRQYLERCGPHRDELLKQEQHIQTLRKLVKTVKDTEPARRLEVLRNECRELTFPPEGLLLPTGSLNGMRVTGLVADKCKYMDSAQKPLWLEYVNADSTGKPLIVIFKDGDDVRQEILVLQMFNIMQRMWEAEGLNVPLSTYGVASLGFEVGFVEVVPGDTLSNITKNAAGASGVWDKTILHKWLKERNPSDEEYEIARSNFTRSCAACCVATYVLGVADRHNDNVMIKEDGHLFHIDFGHFLGHVKRAAGATAAPVHMHFHGC